MALKSDSQRMLWAVPNLHHPSCALPPQVYGIFYATSFLELYRSPHNSTTSAHNITVQVQRDEQYLFLVGSLPPLPSAPAPQLLQQPALTPVPPWQVRVMSPYQGPPSDYVVVKMIPDNRLPPRHLHAVHTAKTFAVIKWESPYDSPDQDMVMPHTSSSWPFGHEILA